TGDGTRGILQPASSVAADRAGSRAVSVSEIGFGAAGAVGSAVLPRSGHGEVVSLLEFVERLSAARHRARQEQTARVQRNAALAVRARGGQARLGAIRPGSS